MRKRAEKEDAERKILKRKGECAFKERKRKSEDYPSGHSNG